MIKYDLIKYSSHALIGFGTIAAFDVFVDGYRYNEGFVMSDATSFAISSVITDLSYDLISNFIPMLGESTLSSYITRPVLMGIVYMYLFNYMTAPKYPGNRDSSKLFILGSLGSLISLYIENPIMSLFNLQTF
jgi:hypothetical protein